MIRKKDTYWYVGARRRKHTYENAEYKPHSGICAAFARVPALFYLYLIPGVRAGSNLPVLIAASAPIGPPR